MTVLHLHNARNAVTETVAELTLYIDDATGDDGNPGTRLLPLKTIVEARSRVPLYIRHTVRIFVADHTGAGYEWPIFGPNILEKNLHVHGGWRLYNPGTGKWDEDPLHTGKNIIVPSTAAGAGSTALVVKSGGLAVNAYRGKYIEILSGAATGDVRSIRNNTATDIVTAVDFSAAVAPGDNYQIFDSSVKILNVSGFPGPIGILASDIGTKTPLVFGYQENIPSLILENIELSDFGWYSVLVNNAAVKGYGIRLSSGAQENYIESRGNLKFGLDYQDFFGGNPASIAFSPYNDFGLPNPLSWSGWGLTADKLNLYHVEDLVGTIVLSGDFHVFRTIRYRLVGGFVKRMVTEKEAGYFRSGQIYCGHSQPFLIDNDDAAKDAIEVYYQSLYLQWVTVGSLRDGIVSGQGSFITSYQVIGNVNGIGMRTRNGGVIHRSGVPAIIGASGDWSYNDGLTVHTNAELTNGRVFGDPFYGYIGRIDL